MRAIRMLLPLGCCLMLAKVATGQGLPPPPFPPQNPLTEQKRLLGKILFWDEQLSSDNTVACGTCHRPGVGGADPRVGRHPGLDNTLNTPDDKLGSPGVIRSDSSDDYERDAIFGLLRQATDRTAPTFLMAAYAPELFWDGRAPSQFVNPQTGAVSIPAGGALESQSVAPPLSDVEMAHEQRDWNQIASKLALARPLGLARNIPPDAAAAIQANGNYPGLFDAAFGSSAITAERIAFAMATYERTLVPNQTPWDRFVAGDPTALTPGQQAGLQSMQNTTCLQCHTPPLFTNNTFRNIGLRPIVEDRGRQEVTNNPADRGRFKVPTLRNVGLKNRFMHNGQLQNLGQVLDFYLEVNGQVQFPDNIDPLVPPIAIPPQARPAVIDFLANALRDPRVAAQQFPFDRPTLSSERVPQNPLLLANGTPGSGSITPAMIALSPPNLGNIGFRIGVAQALGGADAFVLLSSAPPAGNVLTPDETFGPIVLSGAGDGDGFGTWHWPIPDDAALNGRVFYVQWMIADPVAADGFSRTRVAQLSLFCATCPCPMDLNSDGDVDLADLAIVLAHFGQSEAAPEDGDLTGDGTIDLMDLTQLLSRFGIGCG
jgi:cytochrome c peroxidase